MISVRSVKRRLGCVLILFDDPVLKETGIQRNGKFLPLFKQELIIFDTGLGNR